MDVNKQWAYVVQEGQQAERIDKQFAYVLQSGRLDIEANKQYAYVVQELGVGVSLRTSWNVQEAAASVAASVETSWNILAGIAAQIVTSWNVQSDTIGVELVTSWNVDSDAVPIYSELVTFWNVSAIPPGQVGLSVGTSWNVAQHYAEPSRLIVPDYPVVEVWQWKTAVFRSANGREQRRAWLQQPIIAQQFSRPSIEDSDFQQVRELLEVNPLEWFPVPLFQYYAFLDEPATVGDTRLYFDASRVAPVIGQYIVATTDEDDPRELPPVFAQVVDVFDDGCEIALPLTAELDTAFSVSPVLFSRVSANGATENHAVHAMTSYNFIAAERNLDFVSPVNSVVLPTLGGVPLLLKRITADEAMAETYLTGVDVLDNGLSAPILYREEGTRRMMELTFLANRETDPTALAFWRRFGDTVKGQQGTFALSSYRPDAYPATAPQPGETVVDLLGRAFYEVFAQGGYIGLAFMVGRRTYEYRRVLSASLVGNNTRCVLDSGLEGGGYDTVSFVMLMRLASDEITLTHSATSTYIKFTAQQVQE